MQESIGPHFPYLNLTGSKNLEIEGGVDKSAPKRGRLERYLPVWPRTTHCAVCGNTTTGPQVAGGQVAGAIQMMMAVKIALVFKLEQCRSPSPLDQAPPPIGR